jgi:hypothetical protein
MNKNLISIMTVSFLKPGITIKPATLIKPAILLKPVNLFKSAIFTNPANLLKPAVLIVFFILAYSCTKDDDEQEILPMEFQADNKWIEDEITAGEITWYKVLGEEAFTTLYIEWAEADHHGESRSYTGDIKVSAYMLDGITPYFENKNKGYGAETRSFDLEEEKDVLLKVELNDPEKPGTFAIRSTGTSDVGEVSYEVLATGDTWTEASIADGETKGYKVNCGDQIKVQIIWAEVDSPEKGYTAEIKGSVFHLDGETPYADLGNGKDILNKNKSHSDDPKYIQVDPSEKEIRIHIMVNTKPGTFAIKVVPME